MDQWFIVDVYDIKRFSSKRIMCVDTLVFPKYYHKLLLTGNLLSSYEDDEKSTVLIFSGGIQSM